MKRLFLLTLSILLVAVFSIVTAQDTYYINVRSAKVRAEASTKASVVVTLRRGDAVTVLGSVEGTRVSGSTTWYHIQSGNYEGYIHSSLVTNRAPAVLSTPIPTTAPIVSSGGGSSGGSGGGGSSGTSVSCSGDVYNCSDLSCAQVAAYASTCSGDPSRLDADHDGLYCESKC